MNKINKKDRKLLANVTSGLFLIISLYLYWIVFHSTNIYILFGIILTTAIIDGITYNALSKKGKTKKRANSSRNNSRKYKNTEDFNRLRSDENIIESTLEELSWREFERICYLYFKARGYKPRETSNGADGGVDLIIFNRYHQTNEAVQIKHYLSSKNQITVREIRELNSAKRNHDCVLGRFITSSGYTREALIEADKYKIQCHSIEWVKSRIEKWRKSELAKISDKKAK